MSGRLQETSFAELKQRQQSAQSSLSEFSESETTYIAVVSLPRREISDFADEIAEPLGMPEWALKKFLARRSGYRTNSAIESPHDQAYADMNLSAIYHSHLRDSDAADAYISDIVERLVSGENITLVCYEEDGKSCHRHILIEKIGKQVESRENCEFKLRA